MEELLALTAPELGQEALGEIFSSMAVQDVRLSSNIMPSSRGDLSKSKTAGALPVGGSSRCSFDVLCNSLITHMEA